MAGRDRADDRLYRAMWYDSPAEEWTDALPLGNGRLGAMVFSGVGKDQVLLNEKTIWNGGCVSEDRPDAKQRVERLRRLLFEGKYHEAETYCQDEFMVQRSEGHYYQPLGWLRMETGQGADVADYERCLDIGQAVATVQYERDGVQYRREAFVSPADDVIVVRLSADKPGCLSLNLTLDRPAEFRREVVAADMMKMQGNADHRGTHPGVVFEAWLKVVHDGGRAAAGDECIRITGADTVTLFVAAATDYNIEAPSQPLSKDLGAECRGRLEAAGEMPYAELRRHHVCEHRRLFDRVSLSLGVPTRTDMPIDRRIRRVQEGAQDPELLLYYFHYCRYVFISSARPGTLPSNLQGVWNPLLDPPWHSHYQHNVNFQENYWFAETLNLAECHEPFFDLTEGLLRAGVDTARSLGCRGSVAGGGFTGAWFTTTPKGRNVWGMSVMGGAWCARHFMQHYRFTRDVDFLKGRAFPVLREVSLFLLDWLVEDPRTGKLVSGPSASPENSFLDEDGNRCSVTMGCAYDQEMAWDTFGNLLEAAEVLGIEDPLTRDVRAALENLALPIVGSDGRLMEWRQEFKEYEPGHRHVSHLFGMMPGNRLSVDRTPELAAAVRASLDARLVAGYHAQGWSLGWVTALLVRLREGDRALALIEDSYCEKLYPNLFVDAHGRPQVGDMMGVPAAMTEMFVQSRDGEIHLLPALPEKWADGSLKGFCARGAFTVDMSWADGKLSAATIFSRKGGRCSLRYGDKVTALDTEPNQACHVPL